MNDATTPKMNIVKQFSIPEYCMWPTESRIEIITIETQGFNLISRYERSAPLKTNSFIAVTIKANRKSEIILRIPVDSKGASFQDTKSNSNPIKTIMV